ncbi:MAG: M14 family zinc carboxypeptidase [Bacteroidales bacterium]|nr:M14 family zinc carboxypeptidase [Bacteroidales bacterium]MDT8431915.1 M14 family zinc carboxypeptidase [Bacteroidales bacterium]
MHSFRVIASLVAVLLSTQLVHGQQERHTDADTSQTLVRIPVHALNTDPSDQTPAISGQAKSTDPSDQTPAISGQVKSTDPSDQNRHDELSSLAELFGGDRELFRESIRNDSADIAIDPAELERYMTRYPGLRVLKVLPLLDNTDMAASMAEAMTFQKYPTYEQYDSMMHHFAATYPSICRIDTFGTSVQGRLLLALKISDNVEQHEDEPAFFYTSTMHGDELVGYVLCLRFADFLLSNYGSDTEVDRIINDVELWINPLSNPDGAYYPDNNSTVQASIRGNANGVNLNRNFPDPKSGEADDPGGRQPETQAMMAFMKQIRPNLSANIHSGAEVVNYPWDHKYARHPDDAWYVLISREYADEARTVNSGYLNLYPSGITNGADWYIIYGGRQDYVNYYLHGREVTLELSYIKQLESEYLEDHWNYNKWPMVNLVTQSRYGIHGNVTDLYGNPLQASIWVQEHDNDSSWVKSDPVSGNFYRYLEEGVYDLLVSSEGFVPATLFGIEVFNYQKTEISVQLDSLGTSDRAGNLPGDRKNDQKGDPTTLLEVFPNPAHDQLRVKTPGTFSAGTVVILYDLSGRTVLQTATEAGTSSFTMDVSVLQSGVYLLHRAGAPGPGIKIIVR